MSVDEPFTYLGAVDVLADIADRIRKMPAAERDRFFDRAKRSESRKVRVFFEALRDELFAAGGSSEPGGER